MKIWKNNWIEQKKKSNNKNNEIKRISFNNNIIMNNKIRIIKNKNYLTEF